MREIFNISGLKKSLLAKVKPKYLIPPDLTFIIENSSDAKVMGALDKNSSARDAMEEAAERSYERLERQLVIALKEREQNIDAANGDGKAAEQGAIEFEAFYKAQVRLARDAAIRDIERIWAGVARSNREYQAYRLRVDGRIVFGQVGIVRS